MNDKFAHLHLHSHCSFTDGYGTAKQYVKRCKDLGQPAMGVSDHGNTSIHYKWYKECVANGIKPILGCEFYIVRSQEDVREHDYNHITIFAKNLQGYKNLNLLLTKAWNEQFYRKPRITVDDLIEKQEGLIVLSGCLSAIHMQHLRDGQVDEAERFLDKLNKNLDDFWIEVSPIKFKEGNDAYLKLIDLYQKKLKKKGYKWVATNDCHYVEHEHSKVQEVLLCIQSNDNMSNPKRWKFDQDDFYVKSRKEMEDSLADCFPGVDFTDALDNTLVIADSVNFEFPKASPIKFPMPEEEKFDNLHKRCYDALEQMGMMGLAPRQDYIDRVEYELDLIRKKNFLDYFLVIADLVNWAKGQGILVGPARGSAAGSLCCYLLHITEVDPMVHELIFERFIDLNREDLPDIDIDFEDARREEIKKYLQEKYGMDKVGTLATFAEFQGKSAINDIGRVFQIPWDVTNKLSKLIIERSGGDSRASFTIEDTFNNPAFTYPQEAIKKYPELKFAINLEGQYRQLGQHAAGVVISNEPLTNFCAIYNIKGSRVISMGYDDASEIGLLKIDVLGLSTLTVISNCLKLVQRKTGEKIDLYKLPLDDPKVYTIFTREKLFGIFQFDGQAVNQVCRQIKPKNFKALSDINALARPGPLNSGSTTMYINRRSGREKVEYAHSTLKKFTEDTYGIVIYQEQVMKTMREVGLMSWKDTADIRKAISKSQGLEAFNRYREKFAIGARQNKLTEEQIDKIWGAVCTFGSWAFNKSHSDSYAIISYWTAYLKYYHPMEFYGSLMENLAFAEKKRKVLSEFKKEGYKVLPVDINKSKQHFSIEKEGLRIGFTDIKGIGEGAADAIVKNQPFKSYTEFLAKTKGKRITEPVKRHLIDLGAFDSVEVKYDLTLFGEKIPDFEKNPMTFNEHFIVCPWDLEFGIGERWSEFLKQHPKKFPNVPTPISQLMERQGEESLIWGIVYDKNLKNAQEEAMSKGRTFNPEKYRDGNYQFANFVLEDDDDFITVRLPAYKFLEYSKLLFEELQPDDVVMIRGMMGTGIRMFFADKILCLRKFKNSLNEHQ